MSIQIVIEPWTETDVEEGSIANWFVRSGEAVRAGQVLGELMVEKASIEISAPQDGVVQKVFIQRGDVVKPGAVVAEIALASEMAAAPPRARSISARDCAAICARVRLPAPRSTGTSRPSSTATASPR